MAISLYPFLPESAGRMWRQLGMPGDVSERTWDDIPRMQVPAGHKVGSHSPLFAKVTHSDIKDLKKSLGG